MRESSTGEVVSLDAERTSSVFDLASFSCTPEETAERVAMKKRSSLFLIALTLFLSSAAFFHLCLALPSEWKRLGEIRLT